MACQTPAENADSVVSVPVETADPEKVELQRQLEATQADNVRNVALLNDIKRKLEEMSGETVEVRRLQDGLELEPATYATRTDLKEQILSRLESLQQSLEISRASAEQAAAATTETGEPAVDPDLLAGLKTQLDEKEREITSLHVRMTSLAEEAARYRQQREEDSAKIGGIESALSEFRRELERSRSRELERRAQEPEPFQHRRWVPERRSRPTSTFEDWRMSRDVFQGPSRRRADLGWVYYFVGSPEQIEAAFHRGEILSHRGTYHVPESAWMAGRAPRMFRRISAEQNEIHIGYGLRDEEVISAHRWEGGLFDLVEDENGATALRIKDPRAFWERGRYLIVEAEQ